MRAAEQHLEEWNQIVFIISSLLSPLGVAWFFIANRIEKGLTTICNSDRWGGGKGATSSRRFEIYFQDYIEETTGARSFRSPGSKKASTFVIDFLLKPIYNAFRLGGKLGVKPFGNAAAAIRPYLKRATQVDEEVEEFCENINPWIGYVRR